ncbi:hypothetical protein SynSYN20_02898 [Synechococcus sp. SYN20]|nr:hypothetical protein SynSYN20_02898 [Synechococcus sp. SYN20]
MALNLQGKYSCGQKFALDLKEAKQERLGVIVLSFKFQSKCTLSAL